MFDEIGAVSLLRNIASKPSDSMAVIFASKVLETVGEVLPRRLGQAVPSWTVDDVQFWVTQVKFNIFRFFMVQNFFISRSVLGTWLTILRNSESTAIYY